MNRKTLGILAGAAAVLLGSGIALLAHRESAQSERPGAKLFPALAGSLDEVAEIRLSKGDGSRTTLRKEAGGWSVVERQYPADGARVRELLLGLVAMKVVEPKTSDPANYARLGVEAPDTATAASTLVEVVAGEKTWPLIVGRNAEGRALYVRKPDEKAAALVEPSVSVAPDQKRWIDRQLTDLRGDAVHEVEVEPARGPAYLLRRAKRGDSDLALSPVPKGRKPASSMTINAQADGLTAFNFDEIRTAPAGAPSSQDRATFRTFDGQVFELTGHKEGEKAYVSIAARRDPALAARFAESAPKPDGTTADPNATPAATPAATPEATPAGAAAAPAAAAAARPDQNAERVAARAQGLEFEIPLYKYDSIFKPLDELLEPRAESAQ